MSEYERVFRGERVIFIRRGGKVFAGDNADFVGDFFVEAVGRVKPRAYRGTAEREFFKPGEREFNLRFGLFDHRSPAAYFLRESDGDCVLKMRSAALYYSLVFLFEAFEGGDKLFHCGEQLVLYRGYRSYMHCGGESVVGALALVDVVVGVQQLFACDFVTAICDDFVGVHVGLSAASGLPYDQREMLVELAGNNFVASLYDCVELFLGQFAQLVVCLSGCFFENTERMSNFAGHNLAADAEVFVASLGLGSPVFIGGNFHLAHCIFFYTIFHEYKLSG